MLAPCGCTTQVCYGEQSWHGGAGVTDGGDAAQAQPDTAQALSQPGGGRAFPGVTWLRPVFCAVEQAGTRWRILGQAGPTPQQARDILVHELALRAACAPAGSARARAYGLAADRLDRERCDRLTVAGQRFAVARVEQFLRTGPGGPELPRPGDDRPQASPDAPSAARFLGEASTCFAAAERAAGGWRLAWPGEYATPGQARGALIAYLREDAARQDGRAAGRGGGCALAADGLMRLHVSELAIAGRQFRIARIGRFARMTA